ncbi:MAG: hypothetical protein ACM33B_06395 [Pseudomonadota bacterium]
MGKTGPPSKRRPIAGSPPPLRDDDALPLPTAQFRRRAWLAFQRALDPLAPPRPLRPPRQH